MNGMSDTCSRRSSARGFTLLEVVIALSISAILVGFIAMLVSTPVDAYIDQSERSRVVDAGESVSRRFVDDVRSALPRSVRIRNIGSRSIVEMLKVVDVSFYAPPSSPAVPERDFDIGQPNDVFYSFGRFRSSGPALHLVVGHQGSGSLVDAYAGDGIASNFHLDPTGVDGQERITLQGGSVINASDEPAHRLYWISGPVSYICDTASNAKTLRRFSGYTINANIPTSASSSSLNGATNELIASNISACRFECGGSNDDICEEILALEAKIERPAPDADEFVRVLEQVALR